MQEPNEPILPSEENGDKEEIEEIKVAFPKNIDTSWEIPREKEVELIRLAKAGDTEAVRELIASQIRLIGVYARRFMAAQAYYFPKNIPVDYEDFVQAGILGLLQAINEYDEMKSRGARFASFSKFFLKNIMREQLYNSLSIPVPTVSKLRSYSAETQTLARNALNFYSIDDFLPPNEDDPDARWERRGAELEDKAQDIEAALLSDNRREIIQEIVGNLSPKEEFVIKARFFDDDEPSLKEVGEKLNLGRSRIGMIEADALRKIRRELEKRGINLDTPEF